MLQTYLYQFLIGYISNLKSPISDILSCTMYQFLIGYISNLDIPRIPIIVIPYQFLIGYISNLKKKAKKTHLLSINSL